MKYFLTINSDSTTQKWMKFAFIVTGSIFLQSYWVLDNVVEAAPDLMSIPHDKLPWIASKKNARGNARVQMDVIGKILTVHFVTIMRLHFVVQIMLHIKAVVNSVRLNVKALDYMELNLQVILCQKHSFLHQLP